MSSLRKKISVLTPHTVDSVLASSLAGVSGFDTTGSNQVMRSGKKMTYLVAKDYSQVGAVNNGAGYGTTVTTLAVDGFATAPAAGAFVTFAGHNTQYTVQSGTTTTSLIISPGLAASVVDNEAIYIHTSNNRNTDLELSWTQTKKTSTSIESGTTSGSSNSLGDTDLDVTALSSAPQAGQVVTITGHQRPYLIIAGSTTTKIELATQLESNVSNGTAITIQSASDIGLALFDTLGSGTETGILLMVIAQRIFIYALSSGSISTLNYITAASKNYYYIHGELPTTLADDTTFEVRVTITGNQYLKLYVNGQLLSLKNGRANAGGTPWTVITQADMQNFSIADWSGDFWYGAGPNAGGLYIGYAGGVNGDSASARSYADNVSEYES